MTTKTKLMWNTLAHCLICNYLVWLISYTMAYSLTYIVFRGYFTEYKFNPNWPTHKQIIPEFINSAIAIGICSLIEWVISINNAIIWDEYQDPISWTTFMKHLICYTTIILILWVDFHFYFYHIILHKINFLYKYIHKIHHKSKNVNPWSGLSFHPIESFLYFSSMLCFLISPIKSTPKWIFLMYKYGIIVAPLNGHLGIQMGHTFDHFIHHHLFNYNYGSGLLPIWDNICNTTYTLSKEQFFRKHSKYNNYLHN